MKKLPDLDVFYLYTDITYEGDRSQVLRRALSHPQTRELVWLYLAINEIPWKRIRIPKRLTAHYLRQGVKASRLGALWRTQAEILLGRPFRIWYSRQADIYNVEVSRSEEQRWRESIWLRKRQLTGLSRPWRKRQNVRLRSSSSAA